MQAKPKISDRLRYLFMGESREQAGLTRSVDVLLDAFRFQISPGMLMRQLSEIDSQTLELIMQMRGYQVLSSISGMMNDETSRKNRVEESRSMYETSSLSWRAVQILTDFGFGQKIEVSSLEEDVGLADQADVVLDKFWTAKRNQPVLGDRKLQTNSSNLIVDGECFYILSCSKMDGLTTIRRISTLDISGIIYDPKDKVVPLFYKRPVSGLANGETEYSEIWYPDWAAPQVKLDAYVLPAGVVRADQVDATTAIVMVQAALDEIEGRGWPLYRLAYKWDQVYTEFCADIAAKAKAVAAIVNKITHQAGSRGTAAIINQIESSLTQSGVLDTNPPPPAGSTWVQNKAMDLERMPLDTGAADAQKDGFAILGMYSAGTGVPPVWLGRPDMAQNRSVAQEGTLSWIELVQRYQAFWTSIFSDICEVVLIFDKLYGSMTNYISYDVDVTMENPLGMDVTIATGLITAIVGAISTGMVNSKPLEQSLIEILRGTLISMNVQHVDDVLALEASNTDEEPPDEVVEAVARIMKRMKPGTPPRVMAEMFRSAIAEQISALEKDHEQ